MEENEEGRNRGKGKCNFSTTFLSYVPFDIPFGTSKIYHNYLIELNFPGIVLDMILWPC
jgi:hypothetical protein